MDTPLLRNEDSTAKPKPEKPRSWAGQKVEYTTSVVQHRFMGRGQGKINRRALEENLREHGDQGYELINVWWDANIEGEKDGHLLIYKRQRSHAA